MGQTQSLVNGILFPAPPSSYDANLPELIWIPLKYGYTNSGRVLDNVTGKFPALFLDSGCSSKHLILYFHANSCDIGNIRPELRLMGQELGASIVAIEFPGYGLCPKNSSPSPNGIDVRGRAAFYFLINQGIDPRSIVLFGRSIGTGPAAALAAHLSINDIVCGGLVLQAPYISIHRIVQDYVAFASWLVDNYWDTARNLSIMAPKIPLLVVHGLLDEIIPVEHGQSLYQGYKSPLKMADFQPNSKHNQYSIMEDLVAPVAKFLQELALGKDGKLFQWMPPQECVYGPQEPGSSRDESTSRTSGRSNASRPQTSPHEQTPREL